MNHKIKIALGLILIILAFILTVGVLYFFYQRHQMSDQKVMALEVQLANIIAEKSESVLSSEEQKEVQRDPIRIEDVLARAEIIYGSQELERRSGILWIDRKASQGVITLGIVNGLSSGSYLGIYEERRQPGGLVVNEKIGEVVVEQSSDIISYVQPVKKSLYEFDRDYYRVRIESSF